MSDSKIMKYEFREMEKRYWQGKIKASRGVVLSNQYFVWEKAKGHIICLSNCWLEVCLRSEDPATGHLSASSFVLTRIQASVELVPNLQVATHYSAESYSLLPSSKESVFHFPLTFPIHHIFFSILSYLSLFLF